MEAIASDELVVDLFAGAGGASEGLEAALGRQVDIALNHDAVALAAHKANHPNTTHYEADVWKVDPSKATGGRPVFALWASPDCTQFSAAKGGKPRRQGIRILAWAVARWAAATKPRVIFLENVREFKDWGPLHQTCDCGATPKGADPAKIEHAKHCHYDKPIESRKGETFARWVKRLRALGYVVEWRLLDASHYGAPTRRKRLFLVARCDGVPVRWPSPTHDGIGLKPVHTAAECIDWNLPVPSIFGRKKPLAEKTLRRVAEGIKRFVLNNPRPYIVRTAHGDVDQNGKRRGKGAHSIDEPLFTITASNDFALVAPTLIQTGYGEREGQRARYLDLHQPLGTIVAQGQKHALVATFLARHFGGMVGCPVDEALPTITARDHHSLVTANLGAGSRAAEVRAFITAYYGSGTGQEVGQPMRTITAKDRLGLVTVEGVDYAISDISLRMLEPHELLRAQFGRFAADYDLSAAKTKAAKVRLVGNSVCPEVAEALVRANVSGAARRAA